MASNGKTIARQFAHNSTLKVGVEQFDGNSASEGQADPGAKKWKSSEQLSHLCANKETN